MSCYTSLTYDGDGDVKAGLAQLTVLDLWSRHDADEDVGWMRTGSELVLESCASDSDALYYYALLPPQL